MLNFIKLNYGNIIVITILVLLVFFAVIIIRRNKGKCSCCKNSNSCPFAKK